MRVLIQRVASASVVANGVLTGRIGCGFLLLVGIESADTEADVEWLAGKIVRMRLFNDERGLMNLSLSDVGGRLLVVSQFTLHAATAKGNRPSFVRAARPEYAIPLYEKFISALEDLLGQKVESGIFGADMQVELINDGPVTIWIDSRQRE